MGSFLLNESTGAFKGFQPDDWPRLIMPLRHLTNNLSPYSQPGNSYASGFIGEGGLTFRTIKSMLYDELKGVRAEYLHI